MATLVRALRDAGFTEEGCARRLGVDPLLGVQYHHAPAGRLGAMVRSAVGAIPPDWLAWSGSDDPCDVLVGVFLAGESATAVALEQALGRAALDVALRTGLLVADGGSLRCPFCVYPIAGRHLVTDRPGLRPGINPVSALYPETYILSAAADRTRRLSRVLDLGTGSGVHALLAAGHADHVLGVDVNPRALEFARFNAALNDLPGVAFAEGDLFDPCPAGDRYDRIVSNPPYVPSVEHAAGSNWFSGGPTGDEILSRILAGLDAHLSDDGLALLYAMIAHRADEPLRERMDAWLGGLGRWAVTVRAVPFAFRSTEDLDPALTYHELALIEVRRGDGGYQRRWGFRP